MALTLSGPAVALPLFPTRLAAQQDINASTTLVTVNGLSVNVAAGLTYAFEAILYVAADGTGGQKYAVAGTATATAVVYDIIISDFGGLALDVAARTTTLGTSAALAGNTRVSFQVEIRGTITVNAGGTLLIQAAQNSASGTTTILRGSSFTVQQIA